MTVFMTGRTGKTEVAAFLCIITKGMNGLKIEKKIYRVVISRYPRFLRYSGLARRMLEKDIVAAILRHLKQRPRCFAWKTHGGMYGTAGIPDIIACIDGRFYAFEVKQPTGKLTRLQEVTLDKIRVAGGVAVMVTSVKEVKSALDGPALSAGAARPAASMSRSTKSWWRRPAFGKREGLRSTRRWKARLTGRLTLLWI